MCEGGAKRIRIRIKEERGLRRGRTSTTTKERDSHSPYWQNCPSQRIDTGRKTEKKNAEFKKNGNEAIDSGGGGGKGRSKQFRFAWRHDQGCNIPAPQEVSGERA